MANESDIEEIEFVENAESGNENFRDEIPVAEEIRVHFEDHSNKKSRRLCFTENLDKDGSYERSADIIECGDTTDQYVSSMNPINNTDTYDSGERLNAQEVPHVELSEKKTEGTDFIARNKSMVSENSNRFRMEKSKRRPMTTVPKKRRHKTDIGHDNDPRTRNIVRSVRVSSFTRTLPSNSTSSPTLIQENCEDAPSCEWPVLNKAQLRSFKKLFGRFDQNRSGGISTRELFQAVKELLPEENIPFEDVQKVHAELDIKQTGQIEFDEFIFAMTHPKNYIKLIQDDDRERLESEIKLWENFQRSSAKRSGGTSSFDQVDSTPNKNKNLFFTMVRNATRKESMKEIRHFYVNKIRKMNDHVIQDWAAGQRCIGLSNESVLKRFNDIMMELNKQKARYSKELQYSNSPYAQPLQYGLIQLKLNSQPRNSQKSPRIPKILKNVDSDIQRAEIENSLAMRRVKSAGVRRPQTSYYTMCDSRRENNNQNKGRRVKRKSIPQHSSNITPKQNSDEILIRSRCRAKSAPQPDIDSALLSNKLKGYSRSGGGVRSAPVSREAFQEVAAVTPTMVPLPVYTVKKGQQHFNYDSAEKIRRRATGILEEYYSRLRRASVSNSKTLYKKMQVEQISDVQLMQFKRCYSAYLGGSESFVISPWMPHPKPASHWAKIL